MAVVDAGSWLWVFVSMLAIGAVGIRLALAPRVRSGPMDRAAKTLSVIGGVCVLAVAVIELLALNAAV